MNKETKIEEFQSERSFRTLNYLGSKLRILNFIEGVIDNISNDQDGVCDLFSGSGCVSYRLSGKRLVLASDIQEYSRIICHSLLNANTICHKFDSNKLDEKLKQKLYDSFSDLIKLENSSLQNGDIKTMAEIIEHGSIEVYHEEHEVSPISDYLSSVYDKLSRHSLVNDSSLVSRYYGGVYFSYEQSIQIDLLLDYITRAKENEQTILQAALLSTVSDIVNTVGKHFAQPLQLVNSKGDYKIKSTKKLNEDRSIDVVNLFNSWVNKYGNLKPSVHGCKAIKSNYMECLKALPDDIRIVYADPPYTRDHYSRYYHLLETLCYRSIPGLSTTSIHGSEHISRGIYRNDRHQSPFCIKSQALKEFEKIFKFVSETNRKLVLSYSPYDESKKTHPRVVTIHQLTDLAKQYFEKVEVISAGHFCHCKLTSIEHQLDASDSAELLIVCQ